MSYMPRIFYTIAASILLVTALTYLRSRVDPEGLLWFGAWILGMLLVSLTDRRRFGWIHPDKPASARPGRARRRPGRG